jgi:hypothetical protein
VRLNAAAYRDNNRCLNFGSVIFSICGMAPTGVDLNRFLRLMCSGILAKPALLCSCPFTSAILLAALNVEEREKVSREGDSAQGLF